MTTHTLFALDSMDSGTGRKVEIHGLEVLLVRIVDAYARLAIADRDAQRGARRRRLAARRGCAVRAARRSRARRCRGASGGRVACFGRAAARVTRLLRATSSASTDVRAAPRHARSYAPQQ